MTQTTLKPMINTLLTSARLLGALTITLIIMLAIKPVAIASPGGFLNNVSSTFGHVGAVGIEKDSNGNPILAEFDSTGSFVGKLPAEFSGRADLRVMPAQDYNALVSLANRLTQDNLGASLMSLEQYNRRIFKTVSGGPVNKPSVIGRDTRSVLIVDERQLLVVDPPYESVILQEFPVDLSNGGVSLGGNIVTLLVDDNGSIVYQSQYDISYKVALFKTDETGRRIEPVTPVANAFVYSGVLSGGSYGGGAGVTAEDGKYGITVIVPPCPGFAYNYNVPINVDVPVANFNPKAQGNYPGTIPIMRMDNKWCFGYSAFPPSYTLGGLMAQVDAIAIEASLDTNTYNFDMWMSTMQLNAIGTMPGIDLADTTEYSSDDSPIDYTNTYNFDFDGDGNIDIVVPNPTDASKVDVYLNGRSEYDELGNRNEPDITRLKDYVLAIPREDQGLTEQISTTGQVNQGLLKTISKTDLQDTDIYIYRATTNQLIGQLEGLVSRDEDGTVISGSDGSSSLIYKGTHEDEPIATFGFSSLLAGAASFDYFSGLETVSDTYRRRPWLPSESGAADFDNDTRPDFLRPGEEVKIIVINRATGYIGSQTVRLKEIFNIPLDTIKLYPPNLKVIATRTYEDKQGLSQGQLHDNQLIGSEGAGLTSDIYIKIQTVWLDRNGGVLPENLPGYTGRLAISTGGATEDIGVNFEIKPGYNTELLRLKSDQLSTEHFYVQVIGENFDGNPSFASPGAGPGKLQTRPAKYTPVLVPIFNEQATLEAENALRDARQQGIQNLPDNAEPVYHWVYRPEMQFSVYDLTVRDIKLEGGVNNAFDLSIINLTNPVIGVDTIIDVFLTLNSPDNDPLEFFGPGQDLILKIGENEYEIQTNLETEQTFIEIDTDYFADLSVDDFLTISIFLNNDSANTLWQFGFTTLDIDTDSDNTNGLNFPDRSVAEEVIEADPEKSGKVHEVNNGDVNKNAIPDFAEFDYGGAPLNFAPIVVEIPNSIDLSTAKLTFIYAGSDPQLVQSEEVGTSEYPITLYTPSAGTHRIWLKDADETRDPQTDYLVPANQYKVSDLGFTDTQRTRVFYIEGVKVSGLGTASIKMSLDYDE